MRELQPERIVRALVACGALLVLALHPGCDCGDGTSPLPDAHFAPFDASRDGALPGRDGSTCGPTGEGCPCSVEGETRSCVTGGVGACGMGVQTCARGLEFPAWGSCGDVGMPSAETCNGIDDDCNGMTDEGFAELTCGSGACANSVPACASGVPQTCLPLPPRGEECNSLDDDCDAMIDEELASTTCGVGACERTVAGCTGGVPGVCTPGMPGTEACNGADDDCNGMTDESLGSAMCGVGACERTVAACTGGVATPCVPGTPGTETCNAIDDDCNGIVDDGFGTLTCGVGACRRVVLDCSGGGGGVCTPGTAAPESCNGIDDDCDGMVDDGIAPLGCGVGACARTVAACVGGVPATCTPGSPGPEVCNGIDDDCDGGVDTGLADLVCGLGVCRRTAPACSGGGPGTCTPGASATEICGNRLDDDCDGMTDELCACDTAIDADFDGYNQCVDCDDANGAVHPTRPEVCDGIDQDCDGLVDEGFDGDGDTFSTCSADPLLRDCNDAVATTYPGAPELCGPMGTGDGVDNDCDGYIDEVCMPCSTRDGDGDGYSQCTGDCDDTRLAVHPGAAEICDGFDTDCNRFTIDNCGVSERCNWTGGADVCEEDLLCGCVVTGGGTCTGNYICSSFCEGSYTGPLGAGCTATQTCLYRVTLSDNLHGCAETTDPIGTLLAGSVCTGDSQCRSNDCDRYCVGPGCSTQRCVDFCDHHAPGANGSCAAGTVCEPIAIAFMMPAMYARCALDDNGTRTTGMACGAGLPGCIWGTSSCVGGVCAQPCGLDAQCPASFHCALTGNSVTVGTWGAGAPASVMGMPAIETVPVCLGNTGAGLHNRQAGAACARNGDCTSQFCDRTLGVCIATCTSDASCPVGLGCEMAYVRATTGVVSARVCLTAPTTALLQAM